RVVIAAFRPKPGRADGLLQIVQRHHAVLVGQGLVTDRPRIVMRAADGTLIEVFEWRSAEAIEQAHADPTVQALWREFEAVCEYVPIGSVAEAGRMFSEFEPVNS
ncbi:MAG: hypothetical protein ACKPE6_07705, partial [Gammaproteobacteria bacterium]